MNGYAIVACMDEDLDYGPEAVVFGVAGSAVTKMGEGKLELFPDAKRSLLAHVRPIVYATIKNIAKRLGLAFGVTSHVGCGAAAAQAIAKDEVAPLTEEMCKKLGIEYLGHIPHAEAPVTIGNSGLTAHIGRPESEHHHGAHRIVITVGGGITEQEIQMVEGDGYGDGFIVSADWVSQALSGGKVSKDEVLEWLALHVDIADGIADGVMHTASVRVYNANRLEKQIADANHRLVSEMLKKYQKIENTAR